MNWITDTILIGNYVEAQNTLLLSGAKVRSILGLDGKLRSWQTKELGVDRIEVFNLIDGAGNDPYLFRRIVELLGELDKQHAPVLVHCHAGRSRSAVVVAGHLMLTENLSPDAAINHVERKREIQLTPGIEGLLDSLL